MSGSAASPLDDAGALDRIRAICLGWAGVEEVALQDRPLFRVGRRRFALFNGISSPTRARWDGQGRSLHLLAAPDERAALAQDPRFEPSPHHGDRGWVALRLDADTDWDEVAELLDAGYRQVTTRPGGR